MTFEEWRDSERMYDARILGDLWIGVTRLTYGRARIVVASAEAPLFYLDGW